MTRHDVHGVTERDYSWINCASFPIGLIFIVNFFFFKNFEAVYFSKSVKKIFFNVNLQMSMLKLDHKYPPTPFTHDVMLQILRKLNSSCSCLQMS